MSKLRLGLWRNKPVLRACRKSDTSHRNIFAWCFEHALLLSLSTSLSVTLTIIYSWFRSSCIVLKSLKWNNCSTRTLRILHRDSGWCCNDWSSGWFSKIGFRSWRCTEIFVLTLKWHAEVPSRGVQGTPTWASVDCLCVPFRFRFGLVDLFLLSAAILSCASIISMGPLKSGLDDSSTPSILRGLDALESPFTPVPPLPGLRTDAGSHGPADCWTPDCIFEDFDLEEASKFPRVWRGRRRRVGEETEGLTTPSFPSRASKIASLSFWRARVSCKEGVKSWVWGLRRYRPTQRTLEVHMAEHSVWRAK